MPPFGGQFWCIVTDGNDCSETSDTVDTEKNTAIIEQNAPRSIKIYPNPTQSKVFIDADLDIDVRVTDAVGRFIVQLKNVKFIDLEPYADGTYLFTIANKEGQIIGQEKINKITGSR